MLRVSDTVERRLSGGRRSEELAVRQISRHVLTAIRKFTHILILIDSLYDFLILQQDLHQKERRTS